MAGALVAMAFGGVDDNDGPLHWEVGSLRAKGQRLRRGTEWPWLLEFRHHSELHDLPEAVYYGDEWVFVKEVAPPVAAPACPPTTASPPAGPPPPAPAPEPSAAPPEAPAPPSALDWADKLTIINPLGNLSKKERVQRIEAAAEAAWLEEEAPPPAPPPPPSEQPVAAPPAAAPPASTAPPAPRAALGAAEPPAKALVWGYGCCNNLEQEQNTHDWDCDNCRFKMHLACQPKKANNKGDPQRLCKTCFGAVETTGRGCGRGKRARSEPEKVAVKPVKHLSNGVLIPH